MCVCRGEEMVVGLLIESVSSNLPLVLFISFFHLQLHKSWRVIDLLWEDSAISNFHLVNWHGIDDLVQKDGFKKS